MDNPATVSIEDQIACVERELKYREHVYPRRIADKKMTQQLADREMTRMQAVLQTLQLQKITGPS